MKMNFFKVLSIIVFSILILASCKNPFLACIKRKSVKKQPTTVPTAPERPPAPEKPSIPEKPPAPQVNRDGFVKIEVPNIINTDKDFTTADKPNSENPISWKDLDKDFCGVFLVDRKVKLSQYWIAEVETTYSLWREVYNWAIKNGYTFIQAGRAGSSGDENKVMEELPENTTYSEHPVIDVTWRDCIIWCNAYTEMKNGNTTQCVYRKNDNHTVILKDATNEIVDFTYADITKKGFRLPTEAEWEYAARFQKDNKNNNAVNYNGIWLTKVNSASGSDKPIGVRDLNIDALPTESWDSLRDELNRVAVYCRYYYKDKKDPHEKIGWFNLTPETIGTAPIKTKAPNSLGLYDMSGNAYEFCFDWYHTDATINDEVYKNADGIIVNPQGCTKEQTKTSENPSDCRIMRGGAWGPNKVMWNWAINISLGLRTGEGTDQNYRVEGSEGFRLAQSD